MSRFQDGRPRTAIPRLFAVVAALLLVPGATAAQERTEPFEVVVTEAREAAQATIDQANSVIRDSAFLAEEAALMGPVAENLPLIAAALIGYAEILVSLEPPAELAADVSRHVVALRDLAALVTAGATAASVADRNAFSDHLDRTSATLVELVGELDPAYAELAFLSPIDFDFVGVFGALTADERAYLDGVVDARNEFARRLSAFRETLQGTYATPEALLEALAAAGAGEAWPAVEAKALELTPPPRFADEHGWWLERVALQAEIDRRIGHAARDGDHLGFEANNIRLGLLPPAYPELDPAFGAALEPGSPLGERLDPAAVAGDPTGYLVQLFDALRGPGGVRVMDAVQGTFIGLPGAQSDVAMHAVLETQDELTAVADAFASAIVAIEAPAAFENDHDAIVAYVASASDDLDAVIAASAAGDIGAAFSAMDDHRDIYCSTSVALSETVQPATAVYFDAAAPFC